MEPRTQYFDLGQLFWVSSTLSGTKGLYGIAMMEETKLIYTLYHYNLKIFPKYRDKLAPHNLGSDSHLLRQLLRT